MSIIFTYFIKNVINRANEVQLYKNVNIHLFVPHVQTMLKKSNKLVHEYTVAEMIQHPFYHYVNKSQIQIANQRICCVFVMVHYYQEKMLNKHQSMP
jgi:cellobiose-specific phosphotransferase system component IIB